MSSAPIPVVLDVDTGVDDALALLLAARHPIVDLLAVTCVAGNVCLGPVVANTLAVLEAADVADVPVAAGAERPLLRPARDAAHVHGPDGLGGVSRPQSTGTPDRRHAVELLRDTLAASDKPVTIVALAPLTNIALLLRMYPSLVSRIARVVMMGGAAAGGNATAVSEFNTWHDPEAAAMVVDSGLPVTMYGLDVFYRPGLDQSSIALLRDRPDPGARLAADLLQHISRTTGLDSRLPFPGAANLGDAGTVCAVIDPDGLTVQRYPVTVTLGEGPTRGQTVVDQRVYAAEVNLDGLPPGKSVDVALAVDGDRYAELFLSTMLVRQPV
jgi:pyrimidine-specific ribonucleoside hydrolase